jgi:hypothetical protein
MNRKTRALIEEVLNLFDVSIHGEDWYDYVTWVDYCAEVETKVRELIEAIEEVK